MYLKPHVCKKHVQTLFCNVQSFGWSLNLPDGGINDNALQICILSKNFVRNFVIEYSITSFEKKESIYLIGSYGQMASNMAYNMWSNMAYNMWSKAYVEGAF